MYEKCLKSKRGSWKNALMRLAAHSNCYMYVKNVTEQMLECRPGKKIPGPASVSSYTIGLGFLLHADIAYPMGTKLKRFKLKQFIGASDAVKHHAVMLPLNMRNFGEACLSYDNSSIETGCRDFLETYSGSTLGITDLKSEHPNSSGYSEEKFIPVVNIPIFESLPELNLKLEILGA